MPRFLKRIGLTRALLCGMAMAGHMLADCPEVTRQPVDQRCNVGETVRLAAGFVSDIPASFHWHKNGVPLTAANNSFIELVNAQPSDAAVYQCVSRNADGTAATRLARLDVLTPPLTVGQLDPSFHAGTLPGGVVKNLSWGPDGSLWASGEFTSLQGQARPGLARLTTTGQLMPISWQGSGPNANVECIRAHGNGLLMCGRFTTWNSQVAFRLIRVDQDGKPFPANASVVDRLGEFTGTNGDIRQIDVFPDGKLLLSGTFTMVNGVARNRLALLESTGALVTSFLPPALNDDVRTSFRLADGSLLVGGDFTSPRVRLIRLNASTGAELPFAAGHASPDGEVRSMVKMADGGVLLAGEFTRLFGQDRKGIGKLTATGALDANFRANATGELSEPSGTAPTNMRVYQIASDSQGRILVAGDFLGMKGELRHGLCRLLANGTVDLTFQPPAINDGCRCLLATPNDHWLVGGEFTWPRQRLLQILASTPTATTPVIGLAGPVSTASTAGGGLSLSPPCYTRGITTFKWRKNGILLAGKTRPELFLDAVNTADAGQYELEATNAGGSAKGSPMEVLVIPKAAAGLAERTYPANLTTPLPISEGSLSSSSLTLPSLQPGEVLEKMAVRLDVAHPDVSQLYAEIVSPTGSSLLLVSRSGLGGPNFDQTVFDSESPTAFNERTAPYLGSVRPLADFAAVANKPVGGVWTLRMQDFVPDDGRTGNVLSWTIHLRIRKAYAPPPLALHSVDPDGDGIPAILDDALTDHAVQMNLLLPNRTLCLRYRTWGQLTGQHLLPEYTTDLKQWLPAPQNRVVQRFADGRVEMEARTVLPAGARLGFARLKTQLWP